MARLSSGIRQRPDGSYEKRFTINGKRYSVYGESIKAVNAKEFEKKKEIEAGLYKNNNDITVDDYFKEWIARKSNKVKSNTICTYSNIYGLRLSPIIGKFKIKKLERRQMIDLQERLKTDLKNISVNYCMDLVLSMLNGAVSDEIIAKNPAKGIEKLKTDRKKASKTYHRALTIEEQRAFVDALQDEYYREFVLFLLCTGMRYGETAALTWGDIDQKDNVIHVTKTLTKNEKGQYIVGDTTKTKAGTRDIPIFPEIKNILRIQRDKMELLGIIPIAGARVFSPTRGKFVCDGAVNYVIDKAAKKANIEHITAHAMRDTFATRFLEKTGDMQTLKEILGHESITITMDLYAHVLPNTKQEKMNMLADVFNF